MLRSSFAAAFVDVGPLRHARIIEGLHYLRPNAYGGRINYRLPRDHARD